MDDEERDDSHRDALESYRRQAEKDLDVIWIDGVAYPADKLKEADSDATKDD